MQSYPASTTLRQSYIGHCLDRHEAVPTVPSVPPRATRRAMVLDGQNYNFGSVAFTTFVHLATKKQLRLVTPTR